MNIFSNYSSYFLFFQTFRLFHLLTFRLFDFSLFVFFDFSKLILPPEIQHDQDPSLQSCAGPIHQEIPLVPIVLMGQMVRTVRTVLPAVLHLEVVAESPSWLEGNLMTPSGGVLVYSRWRGFFRVAFNSQLDSGSRAFLTWHNRFPSMYTFPSCC